LLHCLLALLLKNIALGWGLLVTIQYSEELDNVKHAMTELRENAVIDFYPEAILQKYNILQVM
jgi:hypothetical protein